MYPPVAMAVPMVAKSAARNIDQPMTNPKAGPTALRPYASGPPANGMATDSSLSARTHIMYSAHTNREARSMPTGPPSFSPWFQPKYSPVMTTPTPSAQTCSTPIGFFSACSLRYSRSSGRSSLSRRWVSLTTSRTTRSSSDGSAGPVSGSCDAPIRCPRQAFGLVSLAYARHSRPVNGYDHAMGKLGMRHLTLPEADEQALARGG